MTTSRDTTSLMNKNHMIPYVNFKIRKDKNFVYINQQNENLTSYKAKQLKKELSQRKLKLRDNNNMVF